MICLKKEYCYSFVLQHPDNRIVVPFTQAKIILTNMYKCDGSMVHVNTIDCPPNVIRPAFLNIGCALDLRSVNDKILSGDNLDYTLQGAVVQDTTTGERFKVRNPGYEYVRGLKGNSPKLQFQYYYLRQNNKVKEYLKYYPEASESFSVYRAQMHKWTNTLWQKLL